MFWMRNKENNFPIHTCRIWRPGTTSCTTILCVFLGQDLDFPDVPPGSVLSALNRNASIPCNLDFPEGEIMEMFMWHHNSDLIIYKGKEGTVKYSYPMLKEKYALFDNFTLEVKDVQMREAGNYTCKKMTLNDTGGGVTMDERDASVELIVQGMY